MNLGKHKNKLLCSLFVIMMISLTLICTFGKGKITASAETTTPLTANGSTIDPAPFGFTPISGTTNCTVKLVDKTIERAVVPRMAEINGVEYTVTEVALNGFASASNLKAVTLPTTVKKIRNTAFQNCKELEIVYFPEVTEIGMNAFSSCPKLSDVILPISVEKIGSTIFRNNNTTVHARAEGQQVAWASNWNGGNGNTVVDYGSEFRHELQYVDTQMSTFSGLDSGITMRSILPGQPLSEDIYASEPIVISNNENENYFLNIESGAFFESKFSTFIVEASNHPINIESYAFEFCEGDSLTINREITFNCPIYGQSLYIMNECQVSVINLPDTMETIVEGMFYCNYELKNVNFIDLSTGTISSSTNGVINLPTSITEIQSMAFASTYNIDYLSIPENVTIGDTVFYDWSENQTIHVPFGTQEEIVDIWGWSWYEYSYAEIEYASIIAYTISYDKNKPNNASGSVNGTTASSSHLYGEDKSLTQNNYSLTGWTFTGWNTKADGSGTPYADEATVRNLTTINGSTITLYAQWIAHTYTVNYDSNIPSVASGSIIGDMDDTLHTYDTTSLLRINAYYLDGWTFVGWNTVADGSGISYADGASISILNAINDAKVVLYAQWTANTYEVIYNNNRPNSASSPTIDSMKKTSHFYDTASPLRTNTITLTGWEFNGWNTIADGSGISYADGASVSTLTTIQNGKVILFAQWIQNTYSVSYNSNKPSSASGTISGAMENTSHTYDTASSLRANAYYLDGWTFVGWAISESLSVAYADEASISTLNATNNGVTILYAQWIANPYNVSYNSNKPSNASNQVQGTMKSTSHAYDTASPLSINSFTLIGWRFDGWNTAADGSGISYADGASISTLTSANGGIVTLYAQWEAKNYTVYLNGNNGTNNISVTVTFDHPMPVTSVPDYHSDYEFVGYYSNTNDCMYYNSLAGSERNWDIDDGDTLTARYEQVYFYVTFEQKNGTGVGGTERIRIKNGSSWPTISIPTRKGYFIDGYYYSFDIKNRKIYNGDGTFNPNNIVSPNNFNFKQNITLHCTWQVQDYYYFVIDKVHARDTSSTTLDQFKLPYDGDFEFTADERMTWTEYSADRQNIISQDSRAFTRWIMNLNGTQGYDQNTNPWITISTDRHISINVAQLIEQYYPDYTESDPVASIYIRAIYTDDYRNETTCVAEGTLITLADGSQKAVELLTGNELLLVWNLYTGKFDAAPILFIDSDPAEMYEVINLYFSDGTNVKVLYEHAFWDFNLNQYVFLRADAAQYIGHWFNKQITDNSGQLTWTRVQLTNVIVQSEYTTAWSPVTAEHLCYYVNGMLSMPGAINGFINIFEVDSNTMTINVDLFLTDIAEYGLYTYEEFAKIFPISETVFDAFGGQYLKVSIGKGLIDLETIGRLIEKYAEHLDI